jgi:hypothetical protein
MPGSQGELIGKALEHEQLPSIIYQNLGFEILIVNSKPVADLNS